MNCTQALAAERLQIVGRFEGFRRILTSGKYADHLTKPLAYWVLPTDRRLPLALLGRTLDDLLGTSFDELCRTPGIGQKKIDSLMKLLARAANTDPADLPDVVAPRRENRPSNAACHTGSSGNGFDPMAVSEVVWAQWRATVVRCGLGDQRLGRLAPSLSRMTRVIWDTPLRAYTDRTLADLRAMKAHGEKRIDAILAVFHGVHALAANMGPQEHLAVRLAPRWIDRAEQWIGRILQRPGVPGREEVFEEFIVPLLKQIRIDATEQVARLAEDRLGIGGGPITSVRQVARTMGLTRARVYQLLNEINDIMVVRWPSGRHQTYALRTRLRAESLQRETPLDLNQFDAAIELFYPASRRGAAGPLEPVAVPVRSGQHEIELEATA